MIAATTYPLLWDRSLADALEALSGVGFEAVEILVSPPHLGVNDVEARANVSDTLVRLGLQALSVNSPTADVNIASVEPGLRRASVKHYSRLLETAADLEAPLAVVSLGRVHPLQSPRLDDVREIALQSITELAERAATLGVVIGLENLPYKLFQTVGDLVAVCQSLGSPNLGVVLDLANSHGIEDPVLAVKSHSELIRLIQVSDSTTEVWAHDEIGAGEIDFETIWPQIARFGIPTVVELTRPIDPAAQARSRDLLEGFAATVIS